MGRTQSARSPLGARPAARAGGTLHGYPSLSAEQETQETLDAEPPERNDKKQKPAPEPAA